MQVMNDHQYFMSLQFLTLQFANTVHAWLEHSDAAHENSRNMQPYDTRREPHFPNPPQHITVAYQLMSVIYGHYLPNYWQLALNF